MKKLSKEELEYIKKAYYILNNLIEDEDNTEDEDTEENNGFY